MKNESMKLADLGRLGPGADREAKVARLLASPAGCINDITARAGPVPRLGTQAEVWTVPSAIKNPGLRADGSKVPGLRI